MPGNDDNGMKMLGRYLSMAMMLPVATFTGYVIGYFLDKAFHTNFLKIVLLVIGIAAGFLQLFRELNQDLNRK